jgi:hypothetical protein
MADLSTVERIKLEKLFGMGSGYVLNFSDRTFADYMEESTRVDVYAPGYDANGTSKANRLRHFWKRESGHLVARAITALIDYGLETQCIRPEERPEDATGITECKSIASRLAQVTNVPDSAALTALTDEPDFEVVARQVQAAIERNEPQAGLDRLHTFVTTFVRSLCAARGISTQRDKPLHSLFGEYIKALRTANQLESTMTERILKTSISTLEAFNDVRNEQSLAHDNPVLNYDESLLIFRHVASTVHFMKALEERLRMPPPPLPSGPDDIPF